MSTGVYRGLFWTQNGGLTKRKTAGEALNSKENDEASGKE
jgi:hypothetical protein